MTAEDLAARLATLEREMGEVRKILLTGNGHPPLTERVAGLERALATQTWLLRAILGTAVTGVAGQAAALLLR